jgi:membrane protease YdiL (CAAX protease family)
LVTGLGMVLLALHEGLTDTPTPDVAHATLEKLTQSPMDAWTILLMAGAVLGAPIVEELLFRGFVQSGLLRATARPWLSAVAAAGLFGLMHVGGETGMPWYAVVVVTTLGACMGIAYERTRDLATPIVMHILFNASNVAMALLGTR